MIFMPGDRVKCISEAPRIKLHHIYTVDTVGITYDDVPWIKLKEKLEVYPYWAWRFVLVTKVSGFALDQVSE